LDQAAPDRPVTRRRRFAPRHPWVAALVVLAIHVDGAAAAPPVPSFKFVPSSPVAGETVTFSSTSSDPDGDTLSYAWNLDGGRFYDDGSGPTATRSFPSAGDYTVRLRVVDSQGFARRTSDVVTVEPNAEPVADFSVTPANPAAGQTVTLTSSSIDPDGRPLAEQWDVDADGAYDDGTGPEIRTRFSGAGVHRVSLRVTDSGGAVAATSRDVTVLSSALPEPAPGGEAVPRPTPPAQTGRPSAARPRVLRPLPRVRVRGVTTATGARIDVLSVRTPGGTRIRVRCKGRGCPWAEKVKRARFSPSPMRMIRIPGFKRRHLLAGSVIEVFVTHPAIIGKYMRLEIRPGMKPPKRVDRCTSPGRARVRRCPAR
jgi:PKD repeat protein